MANQERQDSRRAAAGILLLVLFEAAHALWLVIEWRIPRGHDAFQYFTLQYYFLNNVAGGDGSPLWLPFMTQGTVANWWYGVQGGLVSNALSLAGRGLQGINFVHLFQLGMLVDELLLLLGTWCLARRFLDTRVGALFVCVTVAASAVWTAQPWYNLHFYYAVPLVLEGLHRFVDTGRGRYLALAGNLLGVTAFGTLPYLLPVVSWMIAVYMVSYLAFNRSSLPARLELRRWAVGLMIGAVAGGVSLAAVYFVARRNTQSIVTYNLGRQLDGTTSLVDFLDYGRNQGWERWAEFVTGVPTSLDYTLYSGHLFVPFLVFGALHLRGRRHAHLGVTSVLLVLFSMGSFVSTIAYYSWPMMDYFRHLALVAPLARVPLCLISGLGFERALLTAGGSTRGIRWSLWLVVVMTLVLLMGTTSFDAYQAWLHGVTRSGLVAFEDMLRDGALRPRVLTTLVFCLLSLSVLVICARRGAKSLGTAALVLPMIHGADAVAFRVAVADMQTTSVAPQQRAMLHFQAMPYSKRRHAATINEYLTHRIHPAPPRIALVSDPDVEYGAQYWSLNSFLFFDEAGSIYRVDHWLRPFDRLLRTFWGQDLDPSSGHPGGLVHYQRLIFPRDPAALMVAGVTTDKVRFHRSPQWHDSTRSVSGGVVASPTELHILGDGADDDGDPEGRGGEAPDVSYVVKEFHSNRVNIDVVGVPAAGSWMVYSDVWHERWRAWVNGVPVPVYQADLAYKAVRLPGGDNDVAFRFQDAPLEAVLSGVQWNALVWLLMLIAATGLLTRNAFLATLGRTVDFDQRL